MKNNAGVSNGAKGRGLPFATKLFMVMVMVLLIMEGLARLADQLWNFSRPVSWVMNTLVPETVLQGRVRGLVRPDDLLPVRIPGIGPPSSMPYVLGGVFITGAVADVEWAWIDRPLDMPGRRIAVLGGSAAFGYPYSYEESFPAQLQERLREREFRVTNHARPGMNSVDILLTAEQMYRWVKPEILIVMAGHNEFIRWQPSWLPQSRSAYATLLFRMSSSRLVSALLYLQFKRLSSPGRTPDSWTDEFTVHAELTGHDHAIRNTMEKYHEWDAELWRRTRDAYLRRFEINLATLLAGARNRGVDVYILTLPIRHKLSPVWKHPQPLGAGEGDWRMFESEASRCGEILEEGRCEEARLCARELIRRWPESPTPYYIEGEAHECAGHMEAALSSYKMCRERMVGNQGSAMSINRIIREVAAQEGATLVDMERFFDDDALNRGVVDLYMDDDCHPNVSGHRRIAEILENVIAQKYE